MFQLIFKNSAVKSTQKYLDRLEPKVNINLHQEMPLPSVRLIRKLGPIVSSINGLEAQIAALSDDQLKAKTGAFKARYQQGVEKQKNALAQLEESWRNASSFEEKDDLNIRIEEAQKEFLKVKQSVLDDMLPDVFAVVRETGKRVLMMRHFDVQMIGGMVLHQGNIAEMTTGEGKTLVATLPAYLNALTGEGVHVVTVNDYLASRDREWMGPLYEFLGLTVGCIQHDMDPRSRQAAYACDIVYGTNNEFGFDYLRDNMVNRREDMVQGKHHFAIVDEVDSILIDEARTPLIISGPAEQSTDTYYKANDIVKKLKGRRITEKDEIDAKHKEIDLAVGFDYLADEKARSIALSEAGEEKVASLFGIDNLHDMNTIEYRHHILQALKAKEFFKLDVDYVIRDREVVIVDEFTGRLMPGRRWSDGLHQAVEAKEGIKIERENQTLATITFQNYFKLYDKLSGMTGTAYTEALEFDQIYTLDVVVIPTNRKLQRINSADCIYRSLREKFNAVVEEINERHQTGQPVLVGTISIEKSELLSGMLKKKGVPHQVLNAKYHEQEAHIIAQAGRHKAVTIATNMAGRGTDIMLGGNAEFLAKNLAKDQLKDKDDQAEHDRLVREFLDDFRSKVKGERETVLKLGGLHVLGTERHESRRIDNQLRGRQGRQGDPGSSRFYVSLEDDLMRLFASDRIIGMMDKLGMEEGQVLEHPWLSGAIENAQKRVEGHNFEIRKHLLEFDNVMNKQREVIYGLRRTILESTNVKDMVMEAIQLTSDILTNQHLLSGGDDDNKDVEGLASYLKTKFHYDLSGEQERLQELTQAEAKEFIANGLKEAYAAKEQQIQPDQLRYLERMVMLHTIDSKWKDHLYAMDQLKEGVGLRGYGQRDPIIEYKREGFEMFQAMYDTIYQEAAEILFKLQPAREMTPMRGVFSSVPQKLIHDEVSGLSHKASAAQAAAPKPPPKSEPIKSTGPKVGRNDPCPCGSGKKYKKCHGQ